MRLVLDTNVFVSILIRPGDTFLSLIDYIDQTATLLYSAETLTELVEVTTRKKFAKYVSIDRAAKFVTWLIESGELIKIDHHVTGSRDLDDNKFLSLSVAGNADYLVTGDKDLLVLGKIGGIAILSPANFMANVGH